MNDPDQIATALVERPAIEDLLRQVAAGDAAALTRLYAQTSEVIFNIARSVVRDYSRAEEVTQEVYVQLWLTGAAAFDSRYGSAWPYLTTIARRRAIDHVRKRVSARRGDTIMSALVEAVDESDVAEVAVNRMAIHAALAGLGERSHRVLTLYYFLDRTYAEISEILALPIGTVKTHHHRALQALRQEFS